MSDFGDFGDPISYMVLQKGTPVYGPDGERIGTVREVLSVPVKDVFDGIILDTPHGQRFADGPDVGEIHEHGVALKLGVDALHEPSANPGALRVGANDMIPEHLQDKLRRAWQRISGNY